MLVMLAVPAVLAVAAVHRNLMLYAPSNMLIWHLRTSPPCRRTAGTLAALTVLLVLAMRAVQTAITAGAPEWLNIVALVLAWDVIKIFALAIWTCSRLVFARRGHAAAREDAAESG